METYFPIAFMSGMGLTHLEKYSVDVMINLCTLEEDG